MNKRSLSIINTLALSLGLSHTSAAEQSARFTVTPKIPTAVSINTLPNATCVLHAKGAADMSHSLRLFSNEQGLVQFQVVPSVESEQSAEVELDCASDSAHATFPLALRPNSSPTEDMPAPATAAAHTSAGPVRPALTEAEAVALSPEVLASKGYPARPNASTAPKGYATWLRAVTQPTVIVTPKLIAHPDVAHHVRPVSNGTETTQTWSGFELRDTPGTYERVQGIWKVPAVSGEFDTTDFSSLWVGIDGDGLSDLVQAGTEQRATNIFFVIGDITFTTYYAWTEFLPQQQQEQVIPNFTVNAGDEIICTVVAGTFNGVFNLENVTRGEVAAVVTPNGTTKVLNAEAEWIMERPSIIGSSTLPGLADYGAANMTDASALSLKTGGWVYYNGAPNEQILMFNNSDLLSLPFPLTPEDISFIWIAFH